MRKKNIVLLIGCLLVVSAQAQRFKGGLHAGLLATQVDGDNHSGYKKAGLFIGAFTNLPFPEKKIQIQFELNYSQKGSSANPIYRIALHQVEPAVLFGWNFWKNFLLEAGLSFNVVASEKEYVNQSLVIHPDGSNFYRFNLEGVGGLGYRFNEHWGASFRYIYSISPLGTTYKLKSGRPVEGYMWNNCLLFRLYYQF